MKVLALPDLHIDEKRPQCRTDEDYFATCLSKIKFCVEQAITNKVDVVLQPGDFWNRPRISYNAYAQIANLLTILQTCKIQVYCVYGQHDLDFRDKNNTMMNSLQKSGLVYIAGEGQRIFINDKDSPGKGVYIYGCSYDSPVPTVQERDCPSILMYHGMVLKDENSKLWAEQTGYKTIKDFLEWDLVISGDNHTSFNIDCSSGHSTTGIAKVINCGCMMRNTIDMFDYNPVISFIEITSNNILSMPIAVPVQAAEKCFCNVEAIKKKDEQDEKIKEFIKSLSGDITINDIDFVKNLTEFIKTNEITTEVQTAIQTVLKNAGK